MSSRNQSRRRPTPRANGQSTLQRTILSRRAMLKGSAAIGLAAGAAGMGLLPGAPRLAAAAEPSSLTFEELDRVMDERDHWPEGYTRQILMRWGDPVMADAPPFDPAQASPEAQARQFGYNNDFTDYLPLPWGSDSSDRGILAVSHEYATPHLMWPGLTEDDYRDQLTPEQVRTLMAALGHSILEVKREGSSWQVVADSRHNRRIDLSTPIPIAGPCAGHARMRTAADPSGTQVIGTMTNCNGGVTPWGTVLSGEEGCMDFFAGDYRTLPDQEIVERQGWDEEDNDGYGLSKVEPRFVFENEPNEWNRFDWVVEIDPFDPQAQPVKRTALGRFTHEGAHVATNADGRIVVYMGDDDDFEYIYRFVTASPLDPNDRAANRDILDEGTLSVGRFNEDGTLDWLPLVFGAGPLTPENGFEDQADVLFKTRMAADLLGATPMDAPEGFFPNALTGRVYVALTENEDRLPEEVNVANARSPNNEGHILELVSPGAPGAPDHAADRFTWDVFVLCGDPAKPDQLARFHPATSENGWFTDPDNIGCDPRGRLWVCTDGPPDAGFNDALYAINTEGEGRALPKLFYVPPVGSEVCSPWFTPDGRSLFVSVQHPGELRLADLDDATSLEEAGTTWPDFQPGMPARPSLLVITKDDGGEIGT